MRMSLSAKMMNTVSTQMAHINVSVNILWSFIRISMRIFAYLLQLFSEAGCH